MKKTKKSVFCVILFFIVFSNCSQKDQRKIDEKLIGTWSVSEISEPIIITKDTFELEGKRISAFTELGRIISKETNLPITAYRFTSPEKFKESADTFIDSFIALERSIRALNNPMTEEEINAMKKERAKILENDDSASGKSYRYFRNLEETARNGNILELEGLDMYFIRR
jgi:hypothetical protein